MVNSVVTIQIQLNAREELSEFAIFASTEGLFCLLACCFESPPVTAPNWLKLTESAHICMTFAISLSNVNLLFMMMRMLTKAILVCMRMKMIVIFVNQKKKKEKHCLDQERKSQWSSQSRWWVLWLATKSKAHDYYQRNVHNHCSQQHHHHDHDEDDKW